jgi:hypothetical protein
MTNVAYEEIETPFKAGKKLTRKEALEKINELGLVKVHSNKYGTIWDKEDEPLLKEYGGRLKDMDI